MIRKSYALSVAAVLLIPATAIADAWLFAALDPERAAGHPGYAHRFALLQQLRSAILFGSLALECVLFGLACFWLLRAKSRTQGWLAWALLGAPGFAVIASLPDRAPLRPQDFYERTLARLPLAQLMAERDASSGMWAFGDLMRAAWVFILLYALWPGACNLAAAAVRRLRL